MTPREPSTRGYTLIELAVVCTVIGVLAAAAVPMATKYQRSTRISGARSTLVADIYQTRSLAMMKRKTHQIVFAGGGYTIFQVSPADTIRRRAMPGNVACAATDTATFFAWGLADPVTVTLSSTGTTSKTVRVITNGSVSHD